MTSEEFDARLDEGERKGWVYFLEASPHGPIKIGWAKDPAKRLEQLQTGQPVELNLIGLLPGTRYLEADIHRRLWKARSRGEWFERAATLKLVQPVIASHGVFLVAGCSKSRTIPGTAKWSNVEKREFFVKLEGVR